jgi:hypothetical protein
MAIKGTTAAHDVSSELVPLQKIENAQLATTGKGAIDAVPMVGRNFSNSVQASRYFDLFPNSYDVYNVSTQTV